MVPREREDVEKMSLCSEAAGAVSILSELCPFQDVSCAMVTTVAMCLGC